MSSASSPSRPPAADLALLPASGRVEPWEPAGLAIDPWLVLRLGRYRRREEPPPPIWEAARAMAARAEALVEPRARLVVHAVADAGGGGARLEAGPAFSGRAVGRLLGGCRYAAAFVLTVGGRLEAEVATLADRRELLEAFCLDTAGWAAIEAAVRRLRLDLRARARTGGWRVTHRLAPGYLDWPLGEQRGLLDLFGGETGGVRLSDHGVLVPFKSITGLFGLAPGRSA